MALTDNDRRKRREIRDSAVRSAMRELDRRLRARFGAAYVGLILFGSRARGDDHAESDVDVAVIMRDAISDRWQLKRAIIGDTYPLLLDTGLYIQPWPIQESELDHPDTSPNAALIRNILRDGLSA